MINIFKEILIIIPNIIYLFVKTDTLSFKELFIKFYELLSFPKTPYEFTQLICENSVLFFNSPILTKVIFSIVPLMVSFIVGLILINKCKSNSGIREITSIIIYLVLLYLLSLWYIWLLIILVIILIIRNYCTTDLICCEID